MENKNLIFRKVVTVLCVSLLVAGSTPELALALSRTTPFSVGETTDPGTDAQPCGPTDTNCFPSLHTLQPVGTTTGQGGIMKFLELLANGVNYIGFRAPDAITTDTIWTLPPSDGALNSVLTTDGSGTLSWTIPGASGNTTAGYFTATSTSATSTFAGGLTIGTNGFVFDRSSGRVGIGTSSPQSALHLASSAGFISSGITFGADGNTGIYEGTADTLYLATGGSIRYYFGSTAISSTNGNSFSLLRNAGDVNTPVYSFVGDTDTGISNSSGGELSFVTNGTSRMFINTSGNVGIGTTSPYAKLSVAGDVVADSFNATSSAGYKQGGATLLTASSTTFNTFVGLGAGASVTSGTRNTFLGYQSGQANTSGIRNTGNGYQSLLANTTGSFNTANGYQSLVSNTTGSSNTSSGYGALTWNTVGSSNTAGGLNALGFNDSGSYNTAQGGYALYNNTTGASSTAVGYLAGGANTTGNFNTFLGMNAGYTDGTVITGAALSNATAIGYNAQVTASNSLILGGTGAYGVNVGIGTTSPTSKLTIDYGTANSSTTTPILIMNNPGGTQSGFTFTFSGTQQSQIRADNNGSMVFASKGRQYFAYPTDYGIATDVSFGSQGSPFLFGKGSTGNIGIGTTSPYAKLSVVGEVVASHFTATSTTATSTFANHVSIGTGKSYRIGGVSMLSGDTAGNLNVGINTDISGGGNILVGNSNTSDGYYTAVMGYGNTLNGNAFYGSAIGVSNTVSNWYGTAIGYSNNAGNWGDVAMGVGNAAVGSDSVALGISSTASAAASIAIGLNINNATAGSLMIGPSNAAKLTILSSGNVGIGTTSPYAKLSVAGQVVADYFTATSTTATSTFANHVSIGTGKSYRIGGSPVLSVDNGSGITAVGGSNTAGGMGNNTAIGFSNSAIAAFNSIALGNFNSATNNGAIAIGANVTNNTSGSLMIGPSDAAKLTILSSGNLGIGTTSPYAKLSVVGNVVADALSGVSTTATSTILGKLAVGYNQASASVNGTYFAGGLTSWLNNVGIDDVEIGLGRADNTTAAAGSMIFGGRSRGTLAAPTIALNGDTLLTLQAVGHDGTDFAKSAAIGFEVDGTPGANVMPGRITFSTAPTGTQVPVERMRITNAGNVGIGTTSPYAKLSVVGDVAAEYFSATSTTATSSLMGALRLGSDQGVDAKLSVTKQGSAGNTVYGAYSVLGGAPATGYGVYSRAIGTTNAYSFFADLSGAGGITNGYGLRTSAVFAGTGIANAHGVYVESLAAASNGYGLYVENMGAGTNKFALYSAGTTDKSYFGGNVGIGTTSPYAKLSVVGQVVGSYFTATSTTATSTFTAGVNTGSGNGYFIGGINVLNTNTSAASNNIIGGTAGNLAIGIGNVATSSATPGLAIGVSNIVNDTLGGIAVGYSNTASAYLASAFGAGNIVRGMESSAFGRLNTVNGAAATSFGINNTAAYDNDIAIGYGNSVNGCGLVDCLGAAYAFGVSNTVNADGASAFGSNITNTTDYSVMIGPSDASKLTILSSGNVGIGTTSPYAKLSVVGQVVGSYFTATSTTATSTFANHISIGAGKSYRINGAPVIADGGNTIGSGNINGGTGVVVGVSNSGTNSSSIAIGLSNTSTGVVSTAIGYGNIASNIGSYALGGSNNVSGFFSSAFGMNIVNNVDNSLMIGPSDAAKMTILQSGNVGIGTTSPWAKLSIQNTYGSQSNLFDIATTTSSGFATSSIFSVRADGTVFVKGANAIPPATSILFGVASTTGTSMFSVNSWGRVAIARGDVTNTPESIVNKQSSFAVTSTRTAGTALGNIYNSANRNMYSAFGYNPTTDDSEFYTSNLNILNFGGAADSSSGSVSGSVNYVGKTNTGTAFEVNGAVNYVSISNVNGTTTNAYGTNSQISSLDMSVGAVENAYGLYSKVFGSVFAGAITNAYGLYTDVATNPTNAYSIYASGSAKSYFGGSVGIGTTTPAKALQVFGDIRVGTSSTNGCLENYAGTALVGTCASDERLKTNITPVGSVLAKLSQLTPSTFYWNDTAGTELQNSTTTLNYGLIAQNVAQIFPDMVATTSNGYLGVNYSMLPILTLQGLREANLNLESIASSTLPMTDETGTQTFAGRFFARLTQWFADAGNGIGDLYATVFHSSEVHTDKLCVGDVCVTQEQFLNIVEQNGGVHMTASVQSASISAEEAPKEEPAVTIETPPASVEAAPVIEAVEEIVAPVTKEVAPSVAPDTTEEVL